MTDSYGHLPEGRAAQDAALLDAHVDGSTGRRPVRRKRSTGRGCSVASLSFLRDCRGHPGVTGSPAAADPRPRGPGLPRGEKEGSCPRTRPSRTSSDQLEAEQPEVRQRRPDMNLRPQDRHRTFTARLLPCGIASGSARRARRFSAALCLTGAAWLGNGGRGFSQVPLSRRGEEKPCSSAGARGEEAHRRACAPLAVDPHKEPAAEWRCCQHDQTR